MGTKLGPLEGAWSMVLHLRHAKHENPLLPPPLPQGLGFALYLRAGDAALAEKMLCSCADNGIICIQACIFDLLIFPKGS